MLNRQMRLLSPLACCRGHGPSRFLLGCLLLRARASRSAVDLRFAHGVRIGTGLVGVSSLPAGRLGRPRMFVWRIVVVSNRSRQPSAPLLVSLVRVPAAERSSAFRVHQAEAGERGQSSTLLVVMTCCNVNQKSEYPSQN
jgi:hypothetical protein